jgi:Cu(I)/Ag(I) efflux system periplasmic protein CusF
MKRLVFVLFAASLAAVPAYADEAHHKADKAGASGATAQAGAEMSDGEVRRVDKDAKKITVRHGPLANLDMPAMTMVFQVKDPAMLDRVKVGDKVKFVAEKTGGAFTITKIEPAQ